jgi:RND family efflux transporter MFP subunit
LEAGVRKKKILIAVCIVVIGGSLLLWKYRQATEDPVKVRAITVQKEDMISSVIASGKIDSERIEVIKATMAQAQELLAAKAISQKQLRELEIREYKQEITAANLREKLKKKPIIAPFSGVVIKRNFKPGQKIENGTELLTIVDMKVLVAILRVSEFDISKLQVGQKVILTGETFSGSVEGRVSTISRSADEMTGGGMSTFTVSSSINDPAKEQLLLGSTVEARIVINEKREVTSVPLESILYRKDENIVFVVDGEMADTRTVALGISNQQRIEITGGLAVGEIVVTRGNLDLKEGMRVKILTD